MHLYAHRRYMHIDVITQEARTTHLQPYEPLAFVKSDAWCRWGRWREPHGSARAGRPWAIELRPAV